STVCDARPYTLTSHLPYHPHTFSFHHAIAHLDLHSFPTRRSSDLTSRQLTIEPAADWPSVMKTIEPFPFPLALSKWILIKPKEKDRKSTRLNSSHLGISYAVFCLKKKTDLAPMPITNTPTQANETN